MLLYLTPKGEIHPKIKVLIPGKKSSNLWWAIYLNDSQHVFFCLISLRPVDLLNY